MDMGKVNRQLEMDRTVTCEISRSSIVSFGRGSASTVSCPTVKNLFHRDKHIDALIFR